MNIIMAGVMTGVAISAPVGPLAALAGLRWNEGLRRSALKIAAGVCAGDFVLALLALLVLRAGGEAGIGFAGIPAWVPELVGATVLGGLGAWLLLKSASVLAKPLNVEVGGALLVTLTHPGNIAAYGLMFWALLPGTGRDDGFGIADCALLLAGVLGGMAAGWSLFLGMVEWGTRRYGRTGTRLQVRLMRGIGGVMLLMALGLLVF